MTDECLGPERQSLWLKNPYCHWCGKRTRLVFLKRGQTMPDDGATVDHVFNRLDPTRLSNQSTVLACHKCNQDRGREDQRHLGELTAVIPQNAAARIFDVLHHLCGLTEYWRQDFIRNVQAGCKIYTFKSDLGLSGAFYNTDSHWYVSCPEEDRTPEIRTMMHKANKCIGYIKMRPRGIGKPYKKKLKEDLLIPDSLLRLL